MNESLLSPHQLGENPELAALHVLATSLDVAETVLAAAYPENCEPSCFARHRSEAEAYALSIIYQIDALSVMLKEYTESIERSQHRRNSSPAADDTLF